MIGITIGHISLIWLLLTCVVFYCVRKWCNNHDEFEDAGILINICLFLLCALCILVAAIVIGILITLILEITKAIFGADWMGFFSTVVA